MAYTIPKNSIINRSIKKLDYFDSYTIPLPDREEYTTDYLTARIFNTSSKWEIYLMKLRNAIVKPFGLKTEEYNGGNVSAIKSNYENGDKISLFTVLYRNENEIVMSGDDKHLYFRTSIMKESAENNQINVHLTTIVIFHNIFGKIYFFFVKLFHRLIIQNSLKQFLKAEVNNGN